MIEDHMAAIMFLMGNADVFTSDALRNAYGSLLASILTGAELSVWMGAGRKAVERVWEVCDHGQLHPILGLIWFPDGRSCTPCGWDPCRFRMGRMGCAHTTRSPHVCTCWREVVWKLMIPQPCRNVPRLLRDDSPARDVALRFLSAPPVMARLRSTTPAWLNDIQQWAQDTLRKWVYNQASVSI